MSASGTALGLPLPEGCAGAVISGKYVIERQLGAGSMGAVYQAENVAIRRHVAIKLLSPEYASRVEALGRFEREAQAAAQIGHPHIVDVLDMGRTEAGIPYIVMELLDGEDLRTRLATEGPLRPGAAVDVVLQILGALGAAHAAGIVHRDLKPENVFLVRRGLRNDFVKVIDFGVAKVHDPAGSSAGGTRDGLAIGTPWYMSPEQARGKRTVDARSDLYAVGVLLYEMLSGCLPYPGESAGDVIVAIATEDPPPLTSVAPHVSRGLAAVVTKAMSRDPADRFQTAEELVAALEPYGEAIELEVSDVHAAAAPAAATLPAGLAGSLPTAILDDRVSTIDDAGPGPRRWQVALLAGGAVVLAIGIAIAAWPEAGSQPDARPILPRLQPPPASVGTEPPRFRSAPPLTPPEVVGARTATAASPNPPLPSPQHDAVADPGAPDVPERADPAVASAASAATPVPTVPLEVASNVAGARVLLDGVLLGTTPLVTRVARADGFHVVRVEGDGHLPGARRVRLVSGTKIGIRLRRIRSSRPAPGKAPRPSGGADGTFDPFGH